VDVNVLDFIFLNLNIKKLGEYKVNVSLKQKVYYNALCVYIFGNK